ncbi:MAG: GntR family transcriptional regulator [Actinomycetes bacterium]
MCPSVNGAGLAATVRPPSQAQRAYDEVRDRIVTLVLAPGSPLDEETLSTALGVGRTPLREALQRLASERLVVVYPRRGTFVAEVNITDHGLVADVRRELEGLAAAKAAQRASATDRARLAELTDQIRQPSSGREQGMRLDTVIHREVYEATHNHYLAATLSQYYNLSLRIWYVFLDRLPEIDHAAQHQPMLEAIIAADAQRAAAIAVAHVEAFERAVRQAM